MNFGYVTVNGVNSNYVVKKNRKKFKFSVDKYSFIIYTNLR